MKKMVCLLMTAMMFSFSVPAIAAEPTKAQKDECMLASKDCVHEVLTLQQKIKKLDAEIKGEKGLFC